MNKQTHKLNYIYRYDVMSYYTFKLVGHTVCAEIFALHNFREPSQNQISAIILFVNARKLAAFIFLRSGLDSGIDTEYL